MKALDYIKKGWTQGEFARDSKGDSVPSNSTAAVSWCTAGALGMAYDVCKYMGALNKLAAVIGTRKLSVWNDDPNRTREEVIAAFEKAGV
jgi:hypothetical protein